MTRFAVGGNGDGNRRRSCAVGGDGGKGNRRRPTEKESPLPKRFRVSSFTPVPIGSNGDASSSNPARRIETDDSMIDYNGLFWPGLVSAPHPPQLVTQERTAIPYSVSESEGESDSDCATPAMSEEECGEEVEMGAEVLTSGARMSAAPGSNGSRASESLHPRGISLTIDADVLDCPICFESLSLPVYQCENGHIACESCCIKMSNKCGSCCLPIGYNRCRALEKVIESVIGPCSNMVRGCLETVRYSNRSDHENACKYGSCSCPFLGCSRTDCYKNLPSHLLIKHSSLYKKIHFGAPVVFSLNSKNRDMVLVEKNEEVVFLLSHRANDFGIYCYLVCVAPVSSEIVFRHELVVRDGDACLKLSAVTENSPSPRCSEYRPKRGLFVSSEFDDLSDSKLELTIWHGGDAAPSPA